MSANYLGARTQTCTDKACTDARCTARFEAMEAARKLFGRDEFNKLLYVVVAPTLRQSTATLDRDHLAALQREELGCR